MTVRTPLHIYGDAASPVSRLTTRVSRRGSTLFASYRLYGDLAEISFPSRLEPFDKRSESHRSDGLWQHTCFELFLRIGDTPAYMELNFSPSMQWAAYSFDGERAGMRNLELWTPVVAATRPHLRFELNARMEFPGLAGLTLTANVTAIIEEISGAKTYWALSHSGSGKPDFHDPACFTLELPPVPSTSSPRT